MKLATLVRNVVAMSVCVWLMFGCESMTTETVDVEAQGRQALQQKDSTVVVGIKPVPIELAESGDIQVLFYIANGTDDDVEYLPWGTPLEERITADIFTVKHDGGEALGYMGIMVKRAPPVAEDYKVLEAGSQLEKIVNLSLLYPTTASGTYEIALKEMLLQNKNDDFTKTVLVDPIVVLKRP